MRSREPSTPAGSSNATLCLALAIGAGTVVSAWLNKVFTFPIYIGAMLVAAFIRNTTDMAGKEIPMGLAD